MGRGATWLRVKVSAGHHYPGWGRRDAAGEGERGAACWSAAPRTVKQSPRQPKGGHSPSAHQQMMDKHVVPPHTGASRSHAEG